MLVGERRGRGEAQRASARGLAASENAGMSSERQVGILPIESLRVPGEGSSARGKSGPKARPKGAAEWTAGRNSSTRCNCLRDAATRKDSLSQLAE